MEWSALARGHQDPPLHVPAAGGKREAEAEGTPQPSLVSVCFQGAESVGDDLGFCLERSVAHG